MGQLPFSSILLLFLAQSIFSASVPPASPFSSGPEDNAIDSLSSPFSSERSLLPGVQVYPATGTLSGLPFQQGGSPFLGQQRAFARGVSADGSLDLETWSKRQAVRMNQENAVIAQLAQMAPHRRNQLVRDVANGNTSAANELVSRLLRDLATSQHGQVAFPHLQQQTNNPFLFMQPSEAAFPFSQNGFSSPSVAVLPLPLQLQLLAAQRQQQMTAASSGIGPMNSAFMANGQANGLNNLNGGFSGTANGFGPNERFLRQQLLLGRSGGQMPFSSGSNELLNELSRPNGVFGSSGSSSFPGQQQAGFTQISPFSQSSPSSFGRTRASGQSSGNNGAIEFGKSLSGASLSSGSGSTAFLRGMDDSDLAPVNGVPGRGFVDDLEEDELFGRPAQAKGVLGIGQMQRRNSGRWAEGDGQRGRRERRN